MAALAVNQLLLGYHLSAPRPLSYYSAAARSAASPACCELAWHRLHPDTPPFQQCAEGFRRRCLRVSPPPVIPSPPLIPRPLAAPFPPAAQAVQIVLIYSGARYLSADPAVSLPSISPCHTLSFLRQSLARIYKSEQLPDLRGSGIFPKITMKEVTKGKFRLFPTF